VVLASKFEKNTRTISAADVTHPYAWSECHQTGHRHQAQFSQMSSQDAEQQADERSTSELIHVLGQDIERCQAALTADFDAGHATADGDFHADYEFSARQLIRAIFAFIEAVTFSVKVQSAWRCMEEEIPIQDAERFFATDIEFTVNDKGEVAERQAHIRLVDNIRFAFRLHEKSLKLPATFSPSTAKWWPNLKTAIKVRDRLTHPKMPQDIDVSGDEILAALQAYHGFSAQLLSYGPMD
jgi:hypothetical protein